MIDLRYRVVDVFTDRPLAGNALCVVLDPCPEDLMQRLAREVNLSETTFPTVVADDRYEMRIFTPAVELPFAGHPSIGTAWTLGPNRWTQTTAGATVVVEADTEGAVMTQPDPSFQEVDAGLAVAGLRIPRAQGAWLAEAAGLRHLIVITDVPLEQVVPDSLALQEATRRAGTDGAAVIRRLDDRTVHVRAFFPGAGIGEDPGTGSLAGPVGVLTRRQCGTAIDITVRQGDEIGRPCRIEVHSADGEVRVGGRVTASAEGRFSL